MRQQVLQKLAGQHLAASLLDAGAQLIAAEVSARDHLRKAALAAATEQEVQLFKSCQSKAVSLCLCLIMTPDAVYIPIQQLLFCVLCLSVSCVSLSLCLLLGH